MAASSQDDAEPRGRNYLQILGILFLVWHSILSIVLVLVSLASILGAFHVLKLPYDLPDSIAVGPYPVDVRVASLVFLVLCLGVVALGFFLGIYSIRVSRHPTLARRASRLAIVVLVLSLLGLVGYLSQHDFVMVLVFLYSSLLTGALLVNLATTARCVESGSISAEAPTPDRDSLESAGAFGPGQADLTPDARGLRGFSTIMLIWGVLKVFMGLMLLFGMPADEAFGHDLLSFLASAYGTGLVFVVGGGIDMACGGFSRSLSAAPTYATVAIGLATLCVILYAVVLVGCGLSRALGVSTDSQQVFTAALDVLLGAAVLWYARRVINDGAASSAERGD